MTIRANNILSSNTYQTGSIAIPRAFAPLFQPRRYKVFYGGRGGAKSHNIARYLLIAALQARLRILCARELQGSIHDSVHKLLSDIIAAYPALRQFYAVQKTAIYGANGSEFLFKGLKHNAGAIQSTEGIDKVWVEEAQKVSGPSWDILIPTIRKEGSEIIMSFNPRYASDPAYERFVAGADEDMLVRKVSWRDNPFFPQVLNDERLRLKARDPDAYDHIWEGNFDSSHDGAIFAPYLQQCREAGRITCVPYKPGVEVMTAWDLGKRNATAIIFAQVIGKEVRVIDFHQAWGAQADLIALATMLRGKPYDYAPLGLPHDGKHERLGMPGSIADQLEMLGFKTQSVPHLRKEAQREAARALLQEIWIDEARCDDLLQALMAYRFEYDVSRSCFKDTPLKDWTADAADAFQYLAVLLKEEEPIAGTPDVLPPVRFVRGPYAGFG